MHQLQPIAMSTNDDYTIACVPNPNQGSSGMPVQSTHGRTVNISAQNKPQHCQDQSKEINKTSATLPPVTSDHSTQQANKTTTNNQDSTKSSLASCPPNDSRPLNEGARNQVVSLVKKKPGPKIFSKKRFRTPRDWEVKQICNLGSLRKKEARVSVFAVVSYFFPPKNSGGTDMYFHFGLVDQTLHENDKCLKCMCFQEFEQDIPLVTSIGDIIKFPLRITIYKDNLQGRTFDDQFPWMTFDGRPGAPIVPRYSRCSAPTFTDADKKKVEELRSWAVSIGLVGPNITLADLTDNLYFDFFCQVVHVDNEKNVLYVWDGTEPSFKGLLSNSLEMFASATKWGSKVRGKCVKVTTYGCDLGCTCKVGQYILIPSLHFMLKDGYVSDNEREGVTRIPVFTLHERVLSRRRIKVLDGGDSDVKVLEQRMEMLPTREPHNSQEVPVVNEQPPEKDIDLSKLKVKQTLKRKRVSENAAKAAEIPVPNAQATTAVENTTANEATVQPCNQETSIRAVIGPGATSLVSQEIPVHTKQVITPTVDESCNTASNQAIVNPSTDSRIPTYTIRDIRNGTIATKFRCRATVGYTMPDKPKRFVKYVCKSCRQRYELDNFKNGADTPDFSATVKCINPNCSASLSLTVQFSVILKDDTGLLDVSVTDKVARKFLPHAEPLKLLTDEEIQRDVKRFLETLKLKQDCIEFELKRFSLPNGKTVNSLANWKYTSSEND